jgi:protein TonB
MKVVPILIILLLNGTASSAQDTTLPRPVAPVPPEEKVAIYVEVAPGLYYKWHSHNQKEYISDSLVYPRKAFRKKTEGIVLVQITVTETGEVTNISIVKSLTKETDKEAIRLIRSMPKWRPGRKFGKDVSWTILVPVEFKLREGNLKKR